MDEPLCFVSWSGEWGRRLSGAVKTWLDRDLFADQSGGIAWNSQDITPGSSWLQELESKLRLCKAAVICVTPEALQSPWVNYEVGAVSHAMRSRSTSDQEWLFPLLFGVNPSDLTGPLASVQSIDAEEEGAVRGLAGLLRSKLRCEALPESKADAWDSFQWRQKAVPRLELAEAFPDFADLFQRKSFEEAVSQCVNERWLERYDAVRSTLQKLREHERVIARCCRPYLGDSYRRLMTELDRYAMAVSLLIGKGPFPLGSDGALLLPAGPRVACEQIRKSIKRLVAQLLDRHGPVFDEAFAFQVADSPGELANLISHRKLDVEALAGGSVEFLDSVADCVTFDWVKRQAIGACDTFGECARTVPEDRFRPAALERWRKSPWPFDRVQFSVLVARRIQLAVSEGRGVDDWTAARAWQQLCIEITDPCSVCGIFGHEGPARMAVEYALLPLSLLATFDCAGSWRIAPARDAIAAAVPAARRLFEQPEALREREKAREIALDRLSTIEAALNVALLPYEPSSRRALQMVGEAE